jgi:predicted permease
LWPAIGNKVAAALTIGLVIILILEWRATRHEDFRWFLWTASLTLATYSLVGIPTLAVNNIVLLIPLTYILKILSERMGGKKRWMLIVLLLGLIFVGGWAITLGMQKIKDEVAPNLISLFVSPLLLVAGLYWIRWWATSPPRTWMDTIEWDFK